MRRVEYETTEQGNIGVNMLEEIRVTDTQDDMPLEPGCTVQNALVDAPPHCALKGSGNPLSRGRSIIIFFSACIPRIVCTTPMSARKDASCKRHACGIYVAVIVQRYIGTVILHTQVLLNEIPTFYHSIGRSVHVRSTPCE